MSNNRKYKLRERQMTFPAPDVSDLSFGSDSNDEEYEPNFKRDKVLNECYVSGSDTSTSYSNNEVILMCIYIWSFRSITLI